MRFSGISAKGHDVGFGFVPRMNVIFGTELVTIAGPDMTQEHLVFLTCIWLQDFQLYFTGESLPSKGISQVATSVAAIVGDGIHWRFTNTKNRMESVTLTGHRRRRY